ncbi:nucleotidyltransferase [Sulfurisphaera javensis]|uniref:Nucleotidyltransferase n=1 Tax=Sulfurisphaera javensis TaxID=2049879 RepID=A0AAT9GRG3_9CREN
MGRDYFLDKDIIIGKDGNIYVVYSNINPFGYVYAYLKYIYTGKGIWKGYERALKYYGVHNLLKVNQEFVYEPCYNVSFPIIYESNVLKHLRPEDKIKEVIKSPKNILENIALEIYDKIGVRNIGITGSLLAGISHSSSDIDFVIYGIKDGLDFLNSFNGFERDEDWILETSKNYGISIEDAKELYDLRVRGIYKGVKYSFLFVYPYPLKYCDKVCKNVGEGEIVADISDNTYSIFYPSIVVLDNISLLKGEITPKTLTSYEGIYSMLLFKSKRIHARGMLMECNNGESILIIGDRNVKGYVRRLL